jgi:transcription elongation factor Elf1
MNVSQTETVMKALHGHLGRSVPHRNGERSFHCPFCNHHKRKLQVNIETQKWHCWVCNAKGQTINSLLHKSDAPTYTFDAVRAVYGNVHLTTFKKPSSSITSLSEKRNALRYP